MTASGQKGAPSGQPLEATTIGILEPQSILGKAIGERLVELDPRRSIRGFSTNPELVGELAEFGRGASLIEALDLSTPAVEQVDVGVLFAPVPVALEPLAALRRAMPPASKLVLADGSGWSDALRGADVGLRLFPAIPPLLGAQGIALGDQDDVVLVSPSPSVVCQALLVHALRELGPQRLSTTVLEPVSAQSSQAVEELLAQTRSILAFSGDMPTEHLGDQQAFNIIARGAKDHRELLAKLTGPTLESAEEQVLRAGTFHCVALSMLCHFSAPCTTSAVGDAVRASAPLHWQEPAQESRHPVSVAGKAGLFVSPGSSREEPVACHWLWILADNLTTVGAWNAVSIGTADSLPNAEVH